MKSAYAANLTRWLAQSVLILAGAALVACMSTDDGYVPRNLDLQTVREYDELFFNEVDDPVNRSNRYGDDWKLARKRDFERMAAAGYAPAIAFLRLWDMDQRARKDFSQQPFEMLKQRAQAGDISASCALWPIWSSNHRTGNPDDVRQEFKPFVERGVQAGHFACQQQMSVALRLAADKEMRRQGGQQGATEDDAARVLAVALGMRLTPESTDLLLRSAAQDYHRAHWVLALRLRQAKPLNQALVDQALCWGVVADSKRRNGMSYLTTRGLLQTELAAGSAADRRLLDEMLAKWPESTPAAPAPLPHSTVADCLRLHGR